MNAKESYNLKVASDPFVTQGKMLFTLTWIEGSEYKSSIYSTDGKVIERLTFSGSERAGRIYNNTFYYIQNKEGKDRVVVAEPGKEPRQIFEACKIRKYLLTPRGVLVLAQECSDPKAPFQTERVKYRFDGKGLLRTRDWLYLVEKEVRRVVAGDFEVVDFAMSRDRLVVATTETDDDVGLQDVYEVDLDTTERKKITEGTGSVAALALSPSGELAYLGHRKGKSPWASMEVILPERDRHFLCGNTCGSKVLSDLFDASMDKLQWTDGIYVLGQEGGDASLYRIHDSPERLTQPGLTVRSFDASEGIGYIYTTPEKPSIVHFNGEQDLNPNVKGITPKRVRLDSVEGWYIEASKDAPTILFVHGGPHMAYGSAYFIEFQFFASNGFNVAYSNPRGSQGYGEEFAKGCVGDWGGGDMEDIMSFAKYLRDKEGFKGPWGITGGSYGGFMTNWVITHTDFFSAAISERGISNLLSMCGTSDIGFWFNAVESGVEDPWSPEGRSKLMEMSPIWYVDRVKTPLMLIHGEEDYRCPIEQAEQFYVALRRRGREAVLVRYQGESHEHARRGKPDNMAHRLELKLKWFNEKLKNNILL